MLILRELLRLSDPLRLNEAEVPIELADLIKAFPNKHGKALQKLWGGKRLVWHGKRFFDDDNVGDAYDQAEEAAKEALRSGDPISINVQVDAHDMPGLQEGAQGSSEFDYTVELDPNQDIQEVYLGYDPKRDKLYIGFDAWAHDETTRDEEFDDAFKEATGEEFDIDNPDHYTVYNKMHNNMKDTGFYGLLFEITDVGGEFNAEEAMPPMEGGFYRGTYPQFKRRNPHIVDLRLD